MSRVFGHHALPSAFFVCAESFLIGSAIILAAIVRFSVGDLVFGSKLFYIPHACTTSLIIQLSMYYADLYDFRVVQNIRKLFIKLLQSFAVAAFVLAVIFYALPRLTIGRGIMLFGLPLAFGSIMAWRLLYQHLKTMHQFKMKVLIVGTGEEAKKLARELLSSDIPGYEVKGFIGEDNEIGKRIL